MRAAKHTRVRIAQGWLLRQALGYSRRQLEPGATILIAYHRTPELIRKCIEQIRLLRSPLLRQVLVVDNASGDGVVRALADELVQGIELPANWGHGWALDWAAWQVRTRYLVSLDSDAWPVADGWLEELVGALESGAACAGIYHHRDYVHPSCLAIETSTFLRERLSFVPRLPPPGKDELLGSQFWDVGERISMRLLASGRRLHKLYADRPQDPTARMVGTVYGGVVYHLWYGTRVRLEADTHFDGIPREVIEEERRDRTAGAGLESRS